MGQTFERRKGGDQSLSFSRTIIRTPAVQYASSATDCPYGSLLRPFSTEPSIPETTFSLSRLYPRRRYGRPRRNRLSNLRRCRKQRHLRLLVYGRFRDLPCRNLGNRAMHDYRTARCWVVSGAGTEARELQRKGDKGCFGGVGRAVEREGDR